ncbi:MAG: shikimate dehydrogenase [Nitrospirae bacterium]|nr:shikimate dehydrogenase [Nitrospirota bacterium]MBI5694459.1 shikimate dehydrogenase [Nitrospirota bacterium]
MKITGRTKLVAIFGDPVEHTKSPAMHNAAFEALDMDNAYVPFHIRPEGLGAAVNGLRALGFAGSNITVPHKERVMEFLDSVDPEAKKMGAVNTIVNRDGRLTGYNTDGRGFVMSLKLDAGFDPDKKRVFVCGAGGASRGIGTALAMAGARRVYFYDIDEARRDRLVMDVNSGAGREAARPSILDPDFIRGADLVVNATPLGMHESDPLPMPKESFRPGQVVYDIVYNPARTKTIEAAETAGARTANGLGMLLYQGVLAFEHWFAKTPPVDVMRAALLAGY